MYPFIEVFLGTLLACCPQSQDVLVVGLLTELSENVLEGRVGSLHSFRLGTQFCRQLRFGFDLLESFMLEGAGRPGGVVRGLLEQVEGLGEGETISHSI